MSEPLGIGSKVYWFDENRRVYKPGHSSPVWREKWREVTIVGESPRKWLLSSFAGKIPKKGPLPEGYALDTVGIDRRAWVNDNRYRLAQCVERLTDHDTLKQIAALANYKERE